MAVTTTLETTAKQVYCSMQETMFPAFRWRVGAKTCRVAQL